MNFPGNFAHIGEIDSNELKALVLTGPLAIREELRSLTVNKLTARCARFRSDPNGDPELFRTKTAMRALAQRIQGTPRFSGVG